jgi:hypothetical protein
MQVVSSSGLSSFPFLQGDYEIFCWKC